MATTIQAGRSGTNASVQLETFLGTAVGDTSDLLAELRSVARSSLGCLPDYQVMSSDSAMRANKVVSVARDASGQMLGFASLALPMSPFPLPVVHLGLTCVRPEATGNQLIHRLHRAALVRAFRELGFWRKAWVTSVSSVPHVLVTVGRFVTRTYPSPAAPTPTQQQLAVARWFAATMRAESHVDARCEFDPEAFVFRGGNAGSCFHLTQKRAEFATAHRAQGLSDWYQSRYDAARGDAILQFGQLSMLHLSKYLTVKSTWMKGVKRLGPRGRGASRHAIEANRR
jgi:hypothetical protein